MHSFAWRGTGPQNVGPSPGVETVESFTAEGVMAINDRLQRVLEQTWSSYAVFPHSEAYTAQEVAQSVRVKGGQLAKVVVVRDGAGKDFMVVLPATRYFDVHKLHQVTGRAGIQLEDERELERLFPDCEVGAMPPFGPLYGMPMYVDPCLLRGGDIFFQAGNHHEVVLMRCEEYQDIARPFYSVACLHRDSDNREVTAVRQDVVARRERIGLVRSSG